MESCNDGIMDSVLQALLQVSLRFICSIGSTTERMFYGMMMMMMMMMMIVHFPSLDIFIFHRRTATFIFQYNDHLLTPL